MPHKPSAKYAGRPETDEEIDERELQADIEAMDAAATDIWEIFGDLNPLSPNTDPWDLELAMDEAFERIAETDSPAVRAEAARQFSQLTYLLGGGTLRNLDPRPVITDANPWLEVKDGDPRLFAMFQRHYSYRIKPDRKNRLCIGPGYKIALIIPNKRSPETGIPRAIFAWRLERHRRDNNWGANCAFFRNESGRQSSDLILAAEQYAALRWPYVARYFTHVDPEHVQPKLLDGKPVWGLSYIKAGWRMEPGRTGKGLVTLSKLQTPLGWYDSSWQQRPDWMPPERNPEHDPAAAGTPARRQPPHRRRPTQTPHLIQPYLF